MQKTHSSENQVLYTETEAKISKKIAEAMLLYQEEKFEKAVNILIQLEHGIKTHGPLLSTIGDLLLKLNDFDRAIIYYTKVIAIEPRHLRALRHRGYAYRELALYDQARVDLEQVLSTDHDEKALIALAAVLWEQSAYNDLIQLQTLAGEPKNFKPELAALFALAAHALSKCEIKRNNLEKLQAYTKSNPEIDDLIKGVEIHIKGTLDNLPTLIENPNKHGKHPGQNVRNGEMLLIPSRMEEYATKRKFIYYAAADRTYASRYAAMLRESFIQNTTDEHLHLHLMLKDEEEFETFKHLSCSSVSLSYDKIKNADKVWYTIHRYLKLTELLNAFKCPIVLMDIDSKILGSFETLVHSAENFDVAIYTRDKELYYRQLVKAGLFIANPTEGAERFLKHFEQQISLRSQSGKLAWFSDQEALLESITWAQTTAATKVGKIPDFNMTWRNQVHPRAKLRTFKGVQKLQYLRD